MSSPDRVETRLAGTLVDVVATGRIGRPVFVRWTGQVAYGTASDAADSALQVISRLFGDEPDSTRRLEAAGDRQATALARWPGGESALVAIGPAPPGAGGIADVIVVGTRGAVYHQSGGGGR